MQEFKAYAALRPNGPLEPFSFDPGPLGAEEVEIKVSHCGLCHSDLSMLDNEWDSASDSAGSLIAVSHATNVFPVSNTCAPLLREPLLGAVAALRIAFELSGLGFALCPMR